MFPLWLIAVFSLSSAQNAINIDDGKTVTSHITNIAGGTQLYKFHIDNCIPDEDLAISLTKFSDWSDPDMYVKKGSKPTTTSFDWASLAFGMGSILISPSELSNNTDYFILVSCYTYCRYALTVTYINEITLISGMPISGNLTAGRQAIYAILTENSWSFLKIAASAIFGEFQLFVNTGDIDPTSDKTLPIEHNWHSGQDFYIENPKNDEIYRAAIVALTDTQYTITATTPSNNIQSLQASVPVRGTVGGGQCNVYFIAVDDPNETLVINLTQFSGDADIYASAGKVSSISEFDFAARKYENDTLIISKEMRESIGSPTGFYYISICGFMDSTYSLTVSINKNSFTPLTAGAPEAGFVNYLDIDLFYFELQINVIYNITIQLTALEGNPDLYARLCKSENITDCIIKKEDIATPGPDIHFSNHLMGSDTINIVHRSSFCSKAQACKYIIGVAGASVKISYFTVVALLDLNSELRLQDGRPTSTSIQGSEHRYFGYVKRILPIKNTAIQLGICEDYKDTVYNITGENYRVFFTTYHPAKNTIFRITLTPISGKFSIYTASSLSTSNISSNISNYNWRSDSNSTDITNTVTININDPVTTYLVLIMAEQFSNNSAIFRIFSSIDDCETFLYEDIPYNDQVREKNTKYFRFVLSSSNEDTTITVTALTGDPDLYISASNDIAKPSPANSNFRSNNFGSEAITIKWKDIHTQCPWIPSIPTVCKLFIAVYGFSASTYTIKVHPRRNLPSPIFIGTPEIHQVNKTQEDYFYVTINPYLPLSVTSQPLLGEPDIFMNVFDLQKAGHNMTKWQLPTRTNSTFWSKSTVMTDKVSISSEDLQVMCPSGSCLALIGVNCSTDSCTHSLDAHQEAIQTIYENFPTYGFVNQNQYVYYSYYFDKDDADFLITVTPLSNGDPDLFVAMGRSSKPTRDRYDWTSQNWLGKSMLIIISKNDTHFSNNVSIKGTYIIGVLGVASGSFTLKINNHITPITRLYSGIPQQGRLTTIQMEGRLDISDVAYYSFYNVINLGIIISLVPISGEVILLATCDKTKDYLFYKKLPSLDHYTWSSISANNRYTIYISTRDPNFCCNCTILIAVNAKDYNCIYSITANNNRNFIVLQNGIPFRSSLLPEEPQYYSFEITERTDFDILFTSFSGDINAYVSTSKHINFQNFLWRAISYDPSFINSREKVHFIGIKTNNEYFIVGTYYIWIMCFGDEATYSVTVHTRNVYSILVGGLTITHELEYNRHQKVYFQFGNLLFFKEAVFCSLTSRSKEFRPRVYADFQPVGQRKDFPNQFSSKYKFEKEHYDPLYKELRMTFDEMGYGNLNLAVFGSENDKHQDNELGQFDLFCSSTMNMITLNAGTIRYDHLEYPFIQKRYEVTVNEKGKLDVYVIPCEGKLKLEISSNWTLISKETPDVSVGRLTDGRIQGSINNALGTYYITVSLVESSTNATYQLATVFTKATESAQRNFVPGQDGLLKWERKDGNKIKIIWSEIELEGGARFWDHESVEYHVIFTSDMNVQMMTACGMHTAVNAGWAKYVGSIFGSKLTELEVELPSDVGFVNVIAVVQTQKEKMILGLVVYDPTKIVQTRRSRRRSHEIGQIIFWGAALLLLGFAFAAIWFYRKLKKVKQELLPIEMADLSNVPSDSSEIIEEPALPIRNRRYIGLIEEL